MEALPRRARKAPEPTSGRGGKILLRRLFRSFLFLSALFIDRLNIQPAQNHRRGTHNRGGDTAVLFADPRKRPRERWERARLPPRELPGRRRRGQRGQRGRRGRSARILLASEAGRWTSSVVNASTMRQERRNALILIVAPSGGSRNGGQSQVSHSCRGPFRSSPAKSLNVLSREKPLPLLLFLSRCFLPSSSSSSFFSFSSFLRSTVAFFFFLSFFFFPSSGL